MKFESTIKAERASDVERTIFAERAIVEERTRV